MKLNLLSFLLFLGFLITSCSEPKGTTISGQIEGADNLTVYLDIKSLKNSVQSLVNGTADGQGKFSLNVPEGLSAGLYRLRVGAKGIDMVINGQEKMVKVNGKMTELQNFNYDITGSELSNTYREQIQGLITKSINRTSIDQLIKTSPDALLSTALSFATAPIDPSQFAMYQGFSEKMKTQYPAATITEELAAFATDMEKQSIAAANKYPVKIGDPAPDIIMEDMNGKTRKLSDLKGNVVLLDFWASWCGPCRRANPHVVEMYHKYNKKGFEVFNVSLDGLDSRTRTRFQGKQLADALDKSKKRWEDAIKKDKLTWDNHVSDLMKWDSAGASLYGVRSIPTTFLIDKAGNIAALNPRNNLEAQIKKHI